jgi:hypothetical protein
VLSLSLLNLWCQFIQSWRTCYASQRSLKRITTFYNIIISLHICGEKSYYKTTFIVIILNLTVFQYCLIISYHCSKKYIYESSPSEKKLTVAFQSNKFSQQIFLLGQHYIYKNSQRYKSTRSGAGSRFIFKNIVDNSSVKFYETNS